ncbi:MAG TPA: MBL fold metallo-hydrolase [Candidatus Methanomethylophilaceae archaeon]|nr:MBL fold metallo-hydrolase [Candidatus Methanomethylophilaceae archaeon]
MSTRIVFLGTGGGRHTTMYQTRSTGGFLIRNGGVFTHVDPGPGALTQMQRIRYDLTQTNSVVVSHAHPDHYANAESVIEGFSFGGWRKRGHIYGSVTALKGQDGLGPCISEYHQDIAEDCTVIVPGDTLKIGGMKTEICWSDHNDPTSVGFRFHTDDGIVSYVSDTDFNEELAEQYVGSRVLLLPVTVPDDVYIKGHLCTNSAVDFINIVKPEMAIFVHLGIVMIRAGPDEQAEKVEKVTGIRTIAASDRMIIDIGDDITISEAEAFEEGWIPNTSP